MSQTEQHPRILVLGATGFVGRWLVRELLAQGKPVAIGIRNPGAPEAPAAATEATATATPTRVPTPTPAPTREDAFRQWQRAHGADDAALTVVAADITRPGLGLTPADERRLHGIRDVYNLAALYRFGLGRAEAQAANTGGAVHTLRWAATRPELRRLVHLSGYRVSALPAAEYPLPPREVDALYARVGAYEASKQVGDAAVRVLAPQLGVPLTTVNPSSVIGHSETGEAGQYIGLADLVRQLWTGRLPAVPGTARTFLPVVTIDHLARFLAAVPDFDDRQLHAHTVLDQETPELPALVALLAEHLGLPAPRRTVPVALLRRLPRALTGADPETLHFISEDRYDTTSADRLAEAAGLRQPPVTQALERWAERLLADRFGEAVGGDGPATTPPPGRFTDVAGSRTYLAGEREQPDYVLLHGLPVDSDSWHAVIERLQQGDGEQTPVLLADLPGLGRSSAAATPAAPASSTASTSSTTATDRWFAELLAPVRSKPVIVGHSAGTAPVLRYAAAHPDRIAGVVLVSPYFLQPRPARWLRTPFLLAPALRRATSKQLARTLLGGLPPTGALRSAAANLRRPRVAARTARWLRDAQRPSERAELVALLQSCPVPVRIVVGAADPLADGTPGARSQTVIPTAGHYPQLSHPGQLAAAITEFHTQVR